MEINKRDLDNYITGHYGEDQLKDNDELDEEMEFPDDFEDEDDDEEEEEDDPA